jgi:hypothetical protein
MASIRSACASGESRSGEKGGVRGCGSDIEGFLDISGIVEINNLGASFDDMKGLGFSVMAVWADIDPASLDDEHFMQRGMGVPMGEDSRPV